MIGMAQSWCSRASRQTRLVPDVDVFSVPNVPPFRMQPLDLTVVAKNQMYAGYIVPDETVLAHAPKWSQPGSDRDLRAGIRFRVRADT